MIEARRLRVPAAAALLAAAVTASAATGARAASAHLSGPAHARTGATVTFTETDAPAGTYTMRLVYIAIPDHGGVVGTSCIGLIGTGVPRAGRMTITGKLPARLACSSGAGPVEGHYETRPGHKYDVTVSRNQRGQPFGGEPFLVHPFTVTG